MASVAMRATFNDAPVRGMLARMATFGAAPLDRLYDAIGDAMVASTQLRFRGQHDPLGNPWKPSKRALKQHGKTLIESGHLLASITHNVLPGKGVEWGSALTYSGIHQTGGDITIHPRSQRIYRHIRGNTLEPRFVKKSKSNFATWATISRSYTIHIPARPYLGVSPDDERTIQQLAVTHLQAEIVDGRRLH
jgi:phage gpG-like protein